MTDNSRRISSNRSGSLSWPLSAGDKLEKQAEKRVLLSNGIDQDEKTVMRTYHADVVPV